MDTCRSCQAEIVWAKTVNGKNMPIDLEPSDTGNVELRQEDHGVLRAIVHAQRPLGFDGPLHLPHHATCPDAASWKGKR